MKSIKQHKNILIKLGYRIALKILKQTKETTTITTTTSKDPNGKSCDLRLPGNLYCHYGDTFILFVFCLFL